MFSRSKKENNGENGLKFKICIDFSTNHSTNSIYAFFVSKSSHSEIYCRNPKAVNMEQRLYLT